MTDVVVYGASGFGQQVMFWVRDAVVAGAGWNVLGFVDDDPASHGERRTGETVLGGGDWLRERAARGGLGVVFGLAGPAVKRKLASEIRVAGAELVSVVHPSVVRSGFVEIGPGCAIGPLNVLSTNVVLGEGVTVNTACTLGHDVTVGDHATLLPGANLSGHVTIGAGASVGTNAAVIQNVAVGPGATIGAGATVVRDVAEGVTAVGTPARPVSG